MNLKNSLLSILCSLSLIAFAQKQNIAVKLSILKGENLVTSVKDEQLIEDIFLKTFDQKGYKAYSAKTLTDSSSLNIDSLLFADIIIYQHPADLPSISVMIRRGKYVKYAQNEYKEIAFNRQDAIMELVKYAAEKIPTEFDEYLVALPNLQYILQKHMISMYTGVSSLFTNANQEKSSFEVTYEQPKNIDFVLPNEFEQYLEYCTNFSGFRKQLKTNPIEITYKVNKFGLTLVEDIKFPTEIKPKHKTKIEQISSQFPFWIMKTNETSTFKVKISTK